MSRGLAPEMSTLLAGAVSAPVITVPRLGDSAWYQQEGFA